MITLITTNSEGKLLLPCPFCGETKYFELERTGTNRASSIMSCGNCGCRLETNEIGYGHYWNKRDITLIKDAFDEGVSVHSRSVYISEDDNSNPFIDVYTPNINTQKEKYLNGKFKQD